MKDLYEILGVKKKARSITIKKAYRELAKKHHPDKNGGEHSPEFIEIVKAYKVLSDPVKRKRYDKTGEIEEVNVNAVTVNAIAEMFYGVLNNPNFDTRYHNVFDAINEITESRRAKMRSAVAEKRNTIKKLKDTSKRIKGKDEFFKDLVESNIPGIEYEIQKLEKDINIADSIIAFIKDYDYKTDESRGVAGIRMTV